MNPLTTLDHLDVWVRAGKTFAQAVVACVLAGLANVTDLSSAKALALAALAAGVSAAWNYVLQLKA